MNKKKKAVREHNLKTVCRKGIEGGQNGPFSMGKLRKALDTIGKTAHEIC